MEEIANLMLHPCVYLFRHVSVQSGSDSLLNAMKREYTINEFRFVVDTTNNNNFQRLNERNHFICEKNYMYIYIVMINTYAINLLKQFIK